MDYLTKAEIYFLTKQEKVVNVDFEIEGTKVNNDMPYYGMYESTRRIYTNSKTVRSHLVQEIEIRYLIKKKTEIKCYRNFVVINGNTYNGWTEEMINNIIDGMKKPVKATLEFEWED